MRDGEVDDPHLATGELDMRYLAFLPLFALLGGCNSASSTNAATIPSDGTLKDNYSSTGPAPSEEPKFEKPKDGDEVAVITTKFGKIAFKFRSDLAPKHVENFKTLANKGFYDKTLFHRVMPDFMIQGGDPNTKDPAKVETYGGGGPGYTLKDEFNSLDHKRGVVSMANTGQPNSGGSQFFICVSDHADLNHKYSAFGEVVLGMDVADKIVGQPRNKKDLPNERIEMTVKIAKWPVK